MTPKDKAGDLYCLYSKALFEGMPVKRNKIKKCALVAVDEILNNKSILLIGSRKYWLEVKEEIEKL